jgi:hypothetical protein
MYFRICLASILFMLKSFSLFAQEVAISQDTFLVGELKKTWYLDRITSEGLITYKSEISSAQRNQPSGHRLEFRYNGDFIDAYDDWCGPSREAYEHKGVWRLDEQSRILKCIVYKENGEVNYRVEKISATQLILSLIDKTQINMSKSQ